MIKQDAFVDQTQRQIDALRGSSVRLTLMSVSASGLATGVAECAVRTAAAPHDLIGDLGDGSLGLFSLRSTGLDGAAGIEHHFLMGLQNVLAPLAKRQNIGTIRFRAVHRWASELTDAFDLFDSLFDAPSILITMQMAPPVSMRAPSAPRRTTPPVFRWPLAPEGIPLRHDNA